MILGLSAHTTNLAPLGMPGCNLFASIDAVFPVLGSNQQAVFDLPIPNITGLVGVVGHLQALVPDTGAGNPLGAVMSDAAVATVGR
jgi:hypothetical protein